jgi:hypothetical protein
MDQEVLNNRMKVDPSRITGQFTTIEAIDPAKSIDDQIEAVRAHYASVYMGNTLKDLPVIDCYAFFTDAYNRLCCCITLHLVRVLEVDDGHPWSDATQIGDLGMNHRR